MKNTIYIMLVGPLLACAIELSAIGEDVVLATTARLKSDLAFLASDEMAGRDVGSEGIARAAQFVADRFGELGLKTDSFDGTPFQDFTIAGPAEMGPEEDNRLSFSGIAEPLTLELAKTYNPLSLGGNGSFDGQLVFAGYGITATELGYDDYANIDVRGKVVIVLRKEPQQKDKDSVFDGRRSSQYAFFSSKELNAALHSVAALIIVNDSKTVATDGDKLMNVTAAGGAISDQQVPTFFCSRSLIDPIVHQAIGKSLHQLEEEIDSDLKPRSQELTGITATGATRIEQSRIPVRNVVGILPGVGNLADEFVVIGAHYDHVGMGGQGSLAPGTIEVHNGADDNASGTATLLEIARRCSQDNSENRRSLIFVAFTGEEMGLKGSKHYVRNPRWPLEETVAMVNMDMVGRLTDNALIIFGTGTAAGFDALVDRLNETAEFTLDKRRAGFGPSDHSSFYDAQIPVFHFFTGLHNDYHRPSDDIDKVNYDGMERIGSMVTQLVTHLATNVDRPEYMQSSAIAKVGRPPSRRRPGRGPRAVIGIQLELGGEGASIAAVPAGSAADDAGLEAGDTIIKIGDAAVTSIGDLRRAMAEQKPGATIPIVVRRDEKELQIEITLGGG